MPFSFLKYIFVEKLVRILNYNAKLVANLVLFYMTEFDSVMKFEVITILTKLVCTDLNPCPNNTIDVKIIVIALTLMLMETNKLDKNNEFIFNTSKKILSVTL